MIQPPPSTHHLLPDGVVCTLQVVEHFMHDLLGVGAVTHGVEQVHGALAYTYVPLRLRVGEGGRGALSLGVILVQITDGI